MFVPVFRHGELIVDTTPVEPGAEQRGEDWGGDYYRMVVSMGVAACFGQPVDAGAVGSGEE